MVVVASRERPRAGCTRLRPNRPGRQITCLHQQKNTPGQPVNGYVRPIYGWGQQRATQRCVRTDCQPAKQTREGRARLRAHRVEIIKQTRRGSYGWPLQNFGLPPYLYVGSMSVLTMLPRSARSGASKQVCIDGVHTTHTAQLLRSVSTMTAQTSHPNKVRDHLPGQG